MPRTDESGLFGNVDPSMDGNRYRAEIPDRCRMKELRYHAEESWLTSLQIVVIDPSGEEVELPVVGAPYDRGPFGDIGRFGSVVLDDDEHVQAVSGEARVKSVDMAAADPQYSSASAS